MTSPRLTMVALAVSVLCTAEAFGPDSKMGCINEAKQPVDWWFTMKLPNGCVPVFFFVFSFSDFVKTDK